MKKAFRAVFEALLDGKAYTKHIELAEKRNANAIAVTMISGAISFFVVFIISLSVPEFRYLHSTIACVVIFCTLIAVSSRITTIRASLVYMYIVYAALIAYSTYTSAFVSPNYVCVTVLSFIVTFQCVFVDKNWRINLATVLSAAAYLAVVFPKKDASLRIDEVVNVIAFVIVGIVVGTFMRRTLFRGYKTQESLRLSEEQYKIVLSHSGNVMCRFDVEERSVTMAPEVAESFGILEVTNDIPEYPISIGAIAPESEDIYRKLFLGIINGSRSGSATVRMKLLGEYRWLKASYTTVFSAGKPAYAVLSYADITDRREKEMAYTKWQQEIAAMSGENTGLFERNLTRDELESEGGSLADFFHGLHHETFNGRTEAYAREYIHPDDRQHYVAFLNRERLLGAYSDGVTSGEAEFRELDRDGTYHWMHATVQLVPYPDSTDIKSYVIIKDIDAEKRRLLDTEKRARMDGVTHILNRSAFLSDVSAFLKAARNSEKCAFIMVDLDGFKKVNDSLGHIAGDEFLKATAEKLSIIAGENDIVGRLGGDEFALFITNISDSDAAAKIADRICKKLYKQLENGVTVSASIGVSLYPDDGTGFELLYKRADTALYASKHLGRNRFRFFEVKMEESEYVENATPIDT